MIKIIVNKAKKVNGYESAFISFPYDIDLVAFMRNENNRYWHAQDKIWEIPANRLLAFIQKARNRQITIEGSFVKEKRKIELPKGFYFKTEPYAHQLEGFEYGLKNDYFLLGDEQGLGKTKQGIDIAIAKKISNKYKHCLIITGVNGLKWNWQKEVGIHSNEEAWILGTRFSKNGKRKLKLISNENKLEDLKKLPKNYFLITNIETLRSKEIIKQLKKLCDGGTINMIIVDEIHKAKNPNSQQTKGMLKLDADTKIAMTGTPLMNSPLDLYVALRWLGFEKHSFYQFKNHYCIMGGYGGHEILGYKNLSELQQNLSKIMLRRLKSEVLDLPPKVHSIEYVEMNVKQTLIYNEVMADIRLNIDKIKMADNPLTELIRLRQATGYTGILSSEIQESAKIERLEELVEEIVENDQKIIVFSNWTGITDEVIKRLKRFNPAVITGKTKDADKPIQEKKFMQDESCKCIIGTIGAMGVGLTLTAASTVIFLDSPWNMANKEQAEDRAHRIGTVGTVNIITLVCKDTIDERIEALIEEKGEMADMLVDGKITKNKSQVIDYLLN